MLGSLALAAAALRERLALRRARRLGQRREAARYRRHLARAKPALGMLALGFAGGIASSVWLRGWQALETKGLFKVRLEQSVKGRDGGSLLGNRWGRRLHVSILSPAWRRQEMVPKG